jgi:hypothetical protein
MEKIRKISEDSISVDTLLVKTVTHNREFLLATLERLQAEMDAANALLAKMDSVKDEAIKMEVETVDSLSLAVGKPKA